MDAYEKLVSIAVYLRSIIIMNGIISTIGFSILLYLVFWKTPKATSRFIKYNIVNTATTAWIHAIILVIWQPVPLFPYMGGFSLGPFRHISAPSVTNALVYTMYKMTLILKCNLQFSYMMAFIHNYAILKSNSLPNRLLMSDWRRIVAMFVGCNLIVACLIVVMLDTMFIDRDVAVRNVIQSFNNSGIPSQSEVYDLLLAVHEKEPTMTGYQISRPITIVYLAALCTILSIYTNTTITMNLKIRQHFKQTRDWVHSSTERLQIMVYRAFVRTTLCLVIFNYLPFSVVMLSIIGLIPNYYVAMVASCVISFLAPVSILNIIWTIGPYRRSAKHLLLKAIGKEMRDETKINTIGNTFVKSSSKI